MHPRFVAVTGPREGRVLEIDRTPFSIGRQRSNALQLRDLTVSREHCRLHRAEPEAEGESQGEGQRESQREGQGPGEVLEYVLEDLDSRHGTFVNGVPIGRRKIHHGDVVQVGESMLLFLSRQADGAEPGGSDSLDPESAGSASSVRLQDADFVAERTVERSPGAASPNPREILAALSPTAATARRLEALLGLTTAIYEARQVDELARSLAEGLPTVLPAERTAVLLLDDAGEPTRVHAWRQGGESEREDGWTVSHTLTRRVLEEGTTVLAEDVLQENELQGAESLLSQRIASVACARLTAGGPSGGRPLGVLYADTRDPERRFDEDDLDLLQAVAAVGSVALDRALHLEALEGENRRLRDEELEHELVGESAAIEKLLDFLARAAPTDSTVLLTGESGTGKELAARALHANSPRSRGPFVAVNCATLSENLLASELFGHEKGAFTGALATKPGKLERAHGGTVFLDEVGEIPPKLQAQLLRALEQREIERVGGTRTIAVDVRVVAATNRNLETAIEEGRFRADLYYRLNVVAVTLPPLRDRRDDIPLLARHFARRFSGSRGGGSGGAGQGGRSVTGFTPQALAALRAYDWPGNVRELANAVERAVVLGQETLIRPEDLPEAVVDAGATAGATAGGAAGGGPEPGTTYHEQLRRTKRRVILEALEASDGVVTQAAERLDLHPNYLHRLISNLGLREGDSGEGGDQ